MFVCVFQAGGEIFGEIEQARIARLLLHVEVMKLRVGGRALGCLSPLHYCTCIYTEFDEGLIVHGEAESKVIRQSIPSKVWRAMCEVLGIMRCPGRERAWVTAMSCRCSGPRKHS
jgi:hypothetical protein